MSQSLCNTEPKCLNLSTHFAAVLSFAVSSTIPEFEPEYREETRQMIQTLYTELDGEFKPYILFEDETFD